MSGTGRQQLQTLSAYCVLGESQGGLPEYSVLIALLTRTPLTHWAELTAQACSFRGPQSRERVMGTREGGEALIGCSGARCVIIKFENLTWLFLLQSFRTRTGLYTPARCGLLLG